MNKLFKKAFTLIELIVVIVVLGILAAIVVPNISSWQKEADNARIIADVRNLQTSVDMYAVKNLNQNPTYYPATLGNPAPIDMDKIHPDYVRNLPKGKDMKYWLDYTGTVWASPVDAPEEVSYQAGELTWKEIEEAASYRIYATKPVSLSGAAKKDSKLHFVKETEESKITLPALPEGAYYLVSAVDEAGFETPAVNDLYKGYSTGDKLESNPIVEEPAVPEVPAEPVVTLPPAPIGMMGYKFPEGTIVTASGSYSNAVPQNTIDGSLASVWNAGAYSGVIEYRFPQPETLKGIQLSVSTSPDADRPFVIYGLKNGQWIQLLTETRTVRSSQPILEPFYFASDNYEGIKIEMKTNPSWAAIGEATLIK